jgi:hypothetical protein
MTSKIRMCVLDCSATLRAAGSGRTWRLKTTAVDAEASVASLCLIPPTPEWITESPTYDDRDDDRTE